MTVPNKTDVTKHEELTAEIISAAMRVHTILGPGLLESAYRACLKHELMKRGFRVESEVPVPITYDGVVLKAGYRLDLLVEDLVVVETKTVSKIAPVHLEQLLSHMKLKNHPVGLLINFNVARLKDGIKRVVL